MTPKQRKAIKLCLVILAVSMIVMAISMFVQINHNGWESVNATTIIPFCGMAAVMIMLLKRDDKKDDK